MTDTKNHSSGDRSRILEGRVFQPASLAELAEAVELAFDYRGDVTVSLKSGESLSGYLFNRQVSGSDSYLEVFPSASSDARHIRYDQIAAIAFTGEDTATGKSWETWIDQEGFGAASRSRTCRSRGKSTRNPVSSLPADHISFFRFPITGASRLPSPSA